ncbi:hypothetical protein JHK85_043457 [Glycine max]|nr:hypothetical protein JHK85_043457 [Glycine max]
MAVEMGTGVPWVMCKEDDAPDQVSPRDQNIETKTASSIQHQGNNVEIPAYYIDTAIGNDVETVAYYIGGFTKTICANSEFSRPLLEVRHPFTKLFEWRNSYATCKFVVPFLFKPLLQSFGVKDPNR